MYCSGTELQCELYGWGMGWTANTHDMVGRGCAGWRFCGYRTACNVFACFIQTWEKEMEAKPTLSGLEGGRSSGFTLFYRILGQGWSAREVGDGAVSFVSHKSLCHS